MTAYDKFRSEARFLLAEGFYLYPRKFRDPKTGSYYTFSPSRTIFDKYNLSGNNLAEIVNELSVLVDEKKDELPIEDWQHLNSALRQLMIGHDGGGLLYHLVQHHGVEAINYWAWVRFSMDSDWYVCIDTFRLMPTDIFEEYVLKVWADRTKNFREECWADAMERIGKREDLYGKHSLPSNLVRALLSSD